jgi:hypothetical protein
LPRAAYAAAAEIDRPGKKQRSPTYAASVWTASFAPTFDPQTIATNEPVTITGRAGKTQHGTQGQ